MRTTHVLLAVGLLLGCDQQGLMGGVSDGGSDFSSMGDLATPSDLLRAELGCPGCDAAIPPRDLAPRGDFAGILCGNQVCGQGQSCCVRQSDGGIQVECAASCGDAGIASAQCDGPEDCMQAAPYCCATLVLNGGNPPLCDVASAQASCTASCQTTIALSCTATDRVRLCHNTSECASDTGNPNCCEFDIENRTVSFCVSDLLVTVLSPKCY